jgi:hypothetical protein
VDELLWFLLQIVIEIVGEIILGLAWELLVSLYRSMFDRSNWGIFAAMLGYLAVGVLTGAASVYFWPERVFHVGYAQGISLALAPLCCGWALATWGDFRRSRGHATSGLATFSAGAAFGFGTALTRFVWVQ